VAPAMPFLSHRSGPNMGRAGQPTVSRRTWRSTAAPLRRWRSSLRCDKSNFARELPGRVWPGGSFMRSRYPIDNGGLLTWGTEITMHVAGLRVFDLFRSRYDSESGSDRQIQDGISRRQATRTVQAADIFQESSVSAFHPNVTFNTPNPRINTRILWLSRWRRDFQTWRPQRTASTIPSAMARAAGLTPVRQEAMSILLQAFLNHAVAVNKSDSPGDDPAAENQGFAGLYCTVAGSLKPRRAQSDCHVCRGRCRL